MAKSALQKASELLPDVFKGTMDFIKARFEKDGDNISEATSLGGLLLKLFAKPTIDKFVEKQDAKKTNNYGLNTYIHAGLKQAAASLEYLESKLDNSYSYDAMLLKINQIATESVAIAAKELILVFQPKFHPAVVFVRQFTENIIKETCSPGILEIEFRTHFNENIEAQIKVSFGDELYEKHLKQITKYIYRENETKLLTDLIARATIGFKDNEILEYEKTFAQWKSVHHLFERNEEAELSYQAGPNDSENGLKEITELIEDYFGAYRENTIDNILFIVSDFGKGKSVFLRHYAGQLAAQYLLTKNTPFPIYFNLKNFKNYLAEHKLGIIADYLETDYGIKIDDEYFSNRQYVFLIDSLDECGELNVNTIEKVISSVKKIQTLDKVRFITNRIVLATRPFNNGLAQQLQSNKPFIIFNSENRPIEQFVSIYGFKKSQFSNWLSNSLKRHPNLNYNQSTIIGKYISALMRGDDFDIYNALVQKGIISPSELRRPIFAYMIYQLILNNIDFSAIGKIGVYLSFLNLLTKEAKYIHDTSYKINLKEQFEARNILHAISAVWIYNKNSSNKTEIKKADVCRLLEGLDTMNDDTEILEWYKKSKANEIEFLSHSYFGETNNVLHFQHQSFAEILLAEYYLKVILRFSLDDESNVEEARLMLSLGEPTIQTIEFLKELLIVLKESVATELTNDVAEKRKLLIPLMASLALKNNKRLHSSYIQYRWFENSDFGDNTSIYPPKLIEEWPIDAIKLDIIAAFCAKILHAKNDLFVLKGDFKSSLFNKETFVTNQSLNTVNIDKWISLVIGNEIYNDSEKGRFFNKLVNYKNLFLLLRPFEKSRVSLFPWATSLFKGIDMQSSSDSTHLDFSKLRGIDFSHSFIKNVSFYNSILNFSSFKNCTIHTCDFSYAQLTDVNFTNAIFIGFSPFSMSSIYQSIIFPHKLDWNFYLNKREDIENILTGRGVLSCYGSEAARINTRPKDFLSTTSSILIAGIKNNMWDMALVLKSFTFSNESERKTFKEFIETMVQES